MTFNIDCLRGSPTAKRPFAYTHYAGRDGYVGKAGAAVEHAIIDTLYAFGDGDAGKAGATGERADICNACGDGYITAC